MSDQPDRVVLALAAEADAIHRSENRGGYRSGRDYVVSREHWDRFERWGYIVDGRLSDEARDRGRRIAEGYRADLARLARKANPNAQIYSS